MRSISFVIPAYNEEAYLGACLDSLIREINRSGTDLHTEIIVVDNGSTDATRDVAERRHVQVINESKKGVTFARQRGLATATGDIVVSLDADMHIPSGWLKKILATFEKQPDVVCVSGPYIYYDLPTFWKMIAWPYEVTAGSIAHALTGHCVAGGNFAARRSALTEVGGFDTSISFYGEDLDIATRLKKVGRIIFSPRFAAESSARRFNAKGVLWTTLVYAANFVTMSIAKKPISTDYHDVR